MSDLPNITEESAASLLNGLNIKGWVMTTQGHVLYAIHHGPPGDVPLSDEVFDKWNSSYYATSENTAFVSKSSKINIIMHDICMHVFRTTFNWHRIRYEEQNKFLQRLSKTDAACGIWAHLRTQIKSVEAKIKGDRKQIAIKHIIDGFEPMLNNAKNKFRLTDDEVLEAFEDAVQLLKVRLVMKA